MSRREAGHVVIEFKKEYPDIASVGRACLTGSYYGYNERREFYRKYNRYCEALDALQQINRAN